VIAVFDDDVFDFDDILKLFAPFLLDDKNENEKLRFIFVLFCFAFL